MYDRFTINSIDELKDKLNSLSLDAITKELKEHGISQKKLAEMCHMKPGDITVAKRCEKKRHYFKFLFALKAAGLFMLNISSEGDPPGSPHFQAEPVRIGFSREGEK